KGYFDALEVMIMLNLLRVIDNPYQDIPLVSVLRAPFIGLTENELAEIRLAERNVPFYQSLKTYMQQASGTIHPETVRKLEKFLGQLRHWRDSARRGSLADLVWDIYLKTNYYEMVGAMANGKQRQANLRALHDRALAYEKTSFRGLFRFLRFIDRMKSRGDDLGIAKSIGEADNVVRLVTIHSSKGLEFPVVFVAGLGRQFNMMDFHGSYLFDQDFGMAVKAVHPQDRVMYTSLPYLALKSKRVAKMKAEEMRILYVAMTRAKEKLVLVGSLKDWDDTLKKWSEVQELPGDAVLPNHIRAGAKTYLDWIGPAVARHEDFRALQVEDEESAEIITDSLWKIEVVPSSRFAQKRLGDEEEADGAIEQYEVDEALVNELTKRFTTVYPYMQAVKKKSKTSVSEIKRYEAMQRVEEQDPPFNLLKQSSKGLVRRPMFIQEKQLTGTERGTVVHTVMQHVPQQGFASLEQANGFLQSLVDRQLLHQREADAIDMEDVMTFFATSIGERFKRATYMLREVPFTMSRTDREGDAQIVQGIIDCLFRDEEGRWVLLDYKTDRIRPPFDQEPALTKEMQDRYGMQLAIYEEAIHAINQIQVDERILYLYDIGKELIM
ncbi:MAG: 3'-5' exonuclease, partial [Lysinibacillus sp.]